MATATQRTETSMFSTLLQQMGNKCVFYAGATTITVLASRITTQLGFYVFEACGGCQTIAAPSRLDCFFSWASVVSPMTITVTATTIVLAAGYYKATHQAPRH